MVKLFRAQSETEVKVLFYIYRRRLYTIHHMHTWWIKPGWVDTNMFLRPFAKHNHYKQPLVIIPKIKNYRLLCVCEMAMWSIHVHMIESSTVELQWPVYMSLWHVINTRNDKTKYIFEYIGCQLWMQRAFIYLYEIETFSIL